MRGDTFAIFFAAFVCAVVEGQQSDETNGSTIADRIRELNTLVEKNRERMKKEHFDTHGRVLTDEAIESLIQDARDRAGEGWSEPHLTRRIHGLEESGIAPEEQEHRETQQIISFREGVFVAGASPGFDWNFGRGEYWCVAIPNLPQTTVPEGTTPMTIKNCLTTAREAMVVSYTNPPEYELFMSDVKSVYYEWCLQAENDREGATIEVSTCDNRSVLQQWLVLASDNTWRLLLDNNLCVQAYKKRDYYSWTPPEYAPEYYGSPQKYDSPPEYYGSPQKYDSGTPPEYAPEYYGSPQKYDSATPPEYDYYAPPTEYEDWSDPSHRNLYDADYLSWNPDIDNIVLKLNTCATELTWMGGLQPATRRLGNKKKYRNKSKANMNDRVPQVFIFCFKATVCVNDLCNEIQSCDV